MVAPRRQDSVNAEPPIRRVRQRPRTIGHINGVNQALNAVLENTLRTE